MKKKIVSLILCLLIVSSTFGVFMVPIVAQNPQTMQNENKSPGALASVSTEQRPSDGGETPAAGFVGGDMVKFYERYGKPVQALVWTSSISFAQQLSSEVFGFTFSQVASKADLLQSLSDSSALIIVESASEESYKQLTPKEVSTILNWVSEGNLLLISDSQMLTASEELLDVFGIEGLVPIAADQSLSTENMPIWMIKVNKLTPVSYQYYDKTLYAGGVSAYGMELLSNSKSEVVAYYTQPSTSITIPAVLTLTHGKGTAICFSHDVLTTISQQIDYRWLDLIREALTDYASSLAYLVTKPKEYSNPVSPYIVPMEENDPLLVSTTAIADYLSTLGFSIHYSNLAYNMHSSYYSGLLSVYGPIASFNKVFDTSIQPFYKETVGQLNTTIVSFPAPIQANTKALQFLPRPKYFWPVDQNNVTWAPPHNPPDYYRLSPNEASSDDMNTTAWAPHSVEKVIGALQQRQTYGLDGTGVDVVVIDSGFSHQCGVRSYNTTTGYHPFYEEYYKDFLENRYVPHNNSGTWPDNDEVGHGTGIVSNLLAVAPGITLHFIPKKPDPLVALQIALNINADVVSCSWGAAYDTSPLNPIWKPMEETINQLAANGAICAFAAGNAKETYGGYHSWPASMPNVVGVGGVYVDENNNFQASNYASSFASVNYPGRHVPDICGIVGQEPHGILIEEPTQPGSIGDQFVFANGSKFPYGDETPSGSDGWVVVSGTSSATPQVAGLAALLKQLDPDMTVDEFKSRIAFTATDITTGRSADGEPAAVGYDNATGYGLINVTQTVSNLAYLLFGSYLDEGSRRPGYGGSVHVSVDYNGSVLAAYGGGADIDDFSFRKSTDGGKTWGSRVVIDEDIVYSYFGNTLTFYDSASKRIGVVYHDKGDDLAAKFSADGGSTWKRKNVGRLGMISYIYGTLVGSKILVEFCDYYANYYLYQMSYNIGTNTWSTVTQITNFGNIYSARIFKDMNGRLHLAFCRYDTGLLKYCDIYYMYSDDQGSTWRDINGNILTLPIAMDSTARVYTAVDTIVNGVTADWAGKIYILLSDGRIYFWNGASWTMKTAGISIDGKSGNLQALIWHKGALRAVFIVWDGVNSATKDLVYGYSQDDGNTWSRLTKITWDNLDDGYLIMNNVIYNDKWYGTYIHGFTDAYGQDLYFLSLSAQAIPFYQIRYMRGDQQTVNGLTAYQLSTVQSNTAQSVTCTYNYGNTVYWGIRVWRRLSNGTETEITGGTPVAVVTRPAGTSGEGIQSAMWNCSATSLTITDAIVVRVYIKNGAKDWWPYATFITEPLGATKLDSAIWTVYYYTKREYIAPVTLGYFYWGTTTYNSRTENFAWTPA